MENFTGKGIGVSKTEEGIRLEFVENEFIKEYREWTVAEAIIPNYGALINSIEGLAKAKANDDEWFDGYFPCVKEGQSVHLDSEHGKLKIECVENEIIVFTVSITWDFAMAMRERIIELMQD